MTVRRTPLNDAEASAIKDEAIRLAKEWRLDQKIRFVLENSPLARYDAQRNMKTVPLAGAGFMIAANFTGAGNNGFATEVYDPNRPGTVVFRAERRGQQIEVFNSGDWINYLVAEHTWQEWRVDNPNAALTIENFAPLEGGDE